MRGKVSEHGTGRPVDGATVNFFATRTANDEGFARAGVPATSGADGSFALAVPPRKGFLMVRGPSDDYVLQQLDRGLLLNGQPGGARAYAQAFLACDPKSDGESRDVQISLRPGVTVTGRVVGPDGQPVAEDLDAQPDPSRPERSAWSVVWRFPRDRATDSSRCMGSILIPRLPCRFSSPDVS